MKKLLIILTALFFVTVTNLHATPVAGVLAIDVSGSDMTGMLVTFNYDTGVSQTREWTTVGVVEGEAKHGNRILSFDGSDTWFSNYLDDPFYSDDPDDPVYSSPPFDNPPYYNPDRLAYWELNNGSERGITSFTINAIAGDIVFDIFAILTDLDKPTPFPNTEGSKDGWWQENSFGAMDTSGVSAQGFSWEFNDPISINDLQPVGDLFGSLTITFDAPFTGNFQFGVDTDKVAPVPEPATVVLFGIGLLGLVGAARRRR